MWSIVFIRYKAMREAYQWIRTIVPTPIFILKAERRGQGGIKILIMCDNYIFDAGFAEYLINRLKTMHKSNGSPFIRHGVTLPFLAYAYKCLNNDSSAITVDYLFNIIDSLEKSDSAKFKYEHCSDIDENVISLFSKLYDFGIEEQGFNTRFPNSGILYDPRAYEIVPSVDELYERYNKVWLDNTFSRVYKEDRYGWDIVSEEENSAINAIITDYKLR